MTHPMHTKRRHPPRFQAYFPIGMIEEIQAEAQRQHRTVSQIVRQAYVLARPRIMAFQRRGAA